MQEAHELDNPHAKALESIMKSTLNVIALQQEHILELDKQIDTLRWIVLVVAISGAITQICSLIRAWG